MTDDLPPLPQADFWPDEGRFWTSDSMYAYAQLAIQSHLDTLGKRGLVMVPKEPTPCMIDHARTATIAAYISIEGERSPQDFMERVLLTCAYRAMIDAAKEPTDDPL